MSENEFENALDVKNKLEEFRKFMDKTAERKIREFFRISIQKSITFLIF